jgi:hypothetical protein
MASERWGTFSVIDHINAAALVPEVLMYDRLVIPVPSDKGERARWKKNGWEPDILDRRLDALGDLAIKGYWTPHRRKKFQTRMAEFDRMKFDADNLFTANPFYTTRMILAQTQTYERPPGVTHITLTPAYQSEDSFRKDFIIDKDQRPRKLGVLLGHKFAVPENEAHPEQALTAAIGLARNADFKEKRRDLCAWQERMIAEGAAPQHAIEELEQMIANYNKIVEEASRKVRFRLGFTLANVSLGLLAAGTGVGLVWASASAFISVIQFFALDADPVVDSGRNAPAAMFHEIQTKFPWLKQT